jgi:methanogenic corrinoid protein MtbC1
LADFKRDIVLEAVNLRLEQGEDPIRIIHELQDGMETVGDRFNRAEYFLGELMMSASLFNEAMAILEPKLVVDGLKDKGLRGDLKVIVGGGVTTETVQRHVGADAQTNDAVEGVKMCKGFVSVEG